MLPSRKGFMFKEIPDKVIVDPRKKVLNLTTKQVYKSISEAAKDLGVAPFSIKRSIENDWYVKGVKLRYVNANRD